MNQFHPPFPNNFNPSKSVIQFGPAIPIIAAVVLGLGAGELISGLQDSPDNPSQGTLPDPNKAKADAQATQANQRKILLTSGGQTDYTGGTGVLTGSDVSKTTLLGA